MSTSPADYADHLVRETRAVARFVDVLLRERDLLAQHPVAHSALSAVTEEKSREAAILERLERERRQMAQVLDRAFDKEAFDDHAYDNDGSRDDAALARALDCAAQWSDLRAAAARAEAQNTVNGASIRMHHAQIESRLAFLRNKTSRHLYGANGRTQSQSHTVRSRGGV